MSEPKVNETKPSETKPRKAKSKSSRNLWIALLLILIVCGTVGVTWWVMSQPTFGYARIKVVLGTTVTSEFDGTNYYFSYGSFFFDSTIRLRVSTNGGYGTELPNPTTGSRYEVLGLEVVVSEMHDDYVVLMVKPL